MLMWPEIDEYEWRWFYFLDFVNVNIIILLTLLGWLLNPARHHPCRMWALHSLTVFSNLMEESCLILVVAGESYSVVWDGRGSLIWYHLYTMCMQDIHWEIFLYDVIIIMLRFRDMCSSPWQTLSGIKLLTMQWEQSTETWISESTGPEIILSIFVPESLNV